MPKFPLLAVVAAICAVAGEEVLMPWNECATQTQIASIKDSSTNLFLALEDTRKKVLQRVIQFETFVETCKDMQEIPNELSSNAIKLTFMYRKTSKNLRRELAKVADNYLVEVESMIPKLRAANSPLAGELREIYDSDYNLRGEDYLCRDIKKTFDKDYSLNHIFKDVIKKYFDSDSAEASSPVKLDKIQLLELKQRLLREIDYMDVTALKTLNVFYAALSKLTEIQNALDKSGSNGGLPAEIKAQLVKAVQVGKIILDLNKSRKPKNVNNVEVDDEEVATSSIAAAASGTSTEATTSTGTTTTTTTTTTYTHTEITTESEIAVQRIEQAGESELETALTTVEQEYVDVMKSWIESVRAKFLPHVDEYLNNLAQALKSLKTPLGEKLRSLYNSTIENVENKLYEKNIKTYLLEKSSIEERVREIFTEVMKMKTTATDVRSASLERVNTLSQRLDSEFEYIHQTADYIEQVVAKAAPVVQSLLDNCDKADYVFDNEAEITQAISLINALGLVKPNITVTTASRSVTETTTAIYTHTEITTETEIAIHRIEEVQESEIESTLTALVNEYVEVTKSWIQNIRPKYLPTVQDYLNSMVEVLKTIQSPTVLQKIQSIYESDVVDIPNQRYVEIIKNYLSEKCSIEAHVMEIYHQLTMTTTTGDVRTISREKLRLLAQRLDLEYGYVRETIEYIESLFNNFIVLLETLKQNCAKSEWVFDRENELTTIISLINALGLNKPSLAVENRSLSLSSSEEVIYSDQPATSATDVNAAVEHLTESAEAIDNSHVPIENYNADEKDLIKPTPGACQTRCLQSSEDIAAKTTEVAASTTASASETVALENREEVVDTYNMAIQDYNVDKTALIDRTQTLNHNSILDTSAEDISTSLTASKYDELRTLETVSILARLVNDRIDVMGLNRRYQFRNIKNMEWLNSLYYVMSEMRVYDMEASLSLAERITRTLINIRRQQVNLIQNQQDVNELLRDTTNDVNVLLSQLSELINGRLHTISRLYDTAFKGCTLDAFTLNPSLDERFLTDYVAVSELQYAQRVELMNILELMTKDYPVECCLEGCRMRVVAQLDALLDISRIILANIRATCRASVDAFVGANAAIRYIGKHSNILQEDRLQLYVMISDADTLLQKINASKYAVSYVPAPAPCNNCCAR